MKRDETLKCPFCSYRTKTFYRLKEHIRKKHLINGFCPVCGYRFKNLSTHTWWHAYVDDLHAVILWAIKHGNSRSDEYVKIRERAMKYIEDHS